MSIITGTYTSLSSWIPRFGSLQLSFGEYGNILAGHKTTRDSVNQVMTTPAYERIKPRLAGVGQGALGQTCPDWLTWQIALHFLLHEPRTHQWDNQFDIDQYAVWAPNSVLLIYHVLDICMPMKSLSCN